MPLFEQRPRHCLIQSINFESIICQLVHCWEKSEVDLAKFLIAEINTMATVLGYLNAEHLANTIEFQLKAKTTSNPNRVLTIVCAKLRNRRNFITRIGSEIKMENPE